VGGDGGIGCVGGVVVRAIGAAAAGAFGDDGSVSDQSSPLSCLVVDADGSSTRSRIQLTHPCSVCRFLISNDSELSGSVGLRSG
jgi:hypothetical protein